MLKILNKKQDAFGYLSSVNATNKYYSINNSSPCNYYGYRIKLSKVLMSKLTSTESVSGFTTYTDKNSLEVLPHELAVILKEFINPKTDRRITRFVYRSDEDVVTMIVKNNSYGIVYKTTISNYIPNINDHILSASVHKLLDKPYINSDASRIKSEMKLICEEIKDLTDKISNIELYLLDK